MLDLMFIDISFAYVLCMWFKLGNCSSEVQTVSSHELVINAFRSILFLEEEF